MSARAIALLEERRREYAESAAVLRANHGAEHEAQIYEAFADVMASIIRELRRKQRMPPRVTRRGVKQLKEAVAELERSTKELDKIKRAVKPAKKARRV